MSADEERPVIYGLLALVGVALAVGLVTGVALMAGAHVVGLGGVVAGQPGTIAWVRRSVEVRRTTRTRTAREPDRVAGPCGRSAPAAPDRNALAR